MTTKTPSGIIETVKSSHLGKEKQRKEKRWSVRKGLAETFSVPLAMQYKSECAGMHRKEDRTVKIHAAFILIITKVKHYENT